MTNNYYAVLFDCDGVMCPPLRFAKVLAESHQITMDMTRQFFAESFLPSLLGKVDVAQILPPFLQEWNWQGDVDSFLDLWLTSEREADSAMKAVVHDLRSKGFRVGLATNQESRRAAYMRSHMGFGDLFDDLFISCELGAMKPQPEFFSTVTKSLGIAPESILFIDDQSHYIEAARNFGWKTIQFETSKKLLSELEPSLNRERPLSP